MLADLIQKWVDNVNVPIGHFQSNSAADLLEHILEKEVRLKVRMQNPTTRTTTHLRAHTPTNVGTRFTGGTCGEQI